MSDSLRVMLRVAASTVLALALCLGLVLGVTGCGDDKDDAGDTSTTSAGAGDGTSATDGSGVDSQTDGVDSALIGEWYCEELDETLEFKADGEMIWTEEGEEPSTVITYRIDDDMIAVSIEATEDVRYLPYSIEGGVLTIEDSKQGSLTYTRVQ